MKKLLLVFIAMTTVSIGFNTPFVFSQETAETQESSELPKAPEPQKEEKRITYSPQGARDPFLSLLDGVDKDIRPPGLQGLQISELTLQGIQIGLGKVAIVKGTDNMAYPLRVGDSVFDGKLVEITDNKIIFEKLIYDAFGREKEKQKIEIYLHRK
jgi:Tfp pilus assembly protein PilP